MKPCVFLLGVLALLLLALPISTALAKPSMTEGEPTPRKSLRSLGDVIKTAQNKQVHIIYVHGMRAERPGESGEFLARLEKSFGRQGEVTRSTEHLNLQPWPREVWVGKTRIWDTKSDWDAGQPFIDRYVMKTRDHGVTITVDEVNWWPLLFPLKCRLLLQPEAIVAGVDKPHLEQCFDNKPPYHRWISELEYAEAIATKPALGGAAAANKYLKQQILDWGLSDAVIAAGPMRVYLNAAMDAAFEYASADKATSEYVIITESLGSFVVLDAYSEHKPAVREVLNGTHYLYFFANQFALLELSRLEGIPKTAKHVPKGSVSIAESSEARSRTSVVRALGEWGSSPVPHSFKRPIAMARQIISFSDPSDALTFRVPDIQNVSVSNVYVRNAGSLFGLFANPIKAHSGQMKNSKLWESMLELSNSSQSHPLRR